MIRASLIALALVVVGGGVASAQPAGAIGHPLPSKDTAAGTVTVRVIAGAIGKPVIGVDVTLVVNGTPRVARTDTAGRANFPDLPANATVQAKIVDEDKKEVASDTFPIGADVGTRVMLTTRPMDAMGAQPQQGQPMVDPREASGQPRLEQTYDKGSLSVLAVYGDFKDPAVGVPIALVGYASDDAITVVTKPTNDQGRAEFRNLDVSGNITYFAMTQLPRATGLDRGYARPLELDDRGGVHVILSGDKRASTNPPVDDFTHVQHQDIPTEAGKVRIVISGKPDLPATIKLYDAATKQVVAEGKAERLPADPSRVQFNSQFAARTDLEKGFLGVIVHGGPTGKDEPLKDLVVSAVAVDGSPTKLDGTTDADGQAIIRIPVEPAGKYKLQVTINGATHTTEPFEVSSSGGALEVQAAWDTRGAIQAMIDVAHLPGRVLYAESTNGGQRYRSAPFETIPTAGTQLLMFFYPRSVMTFHLGATVEDQLLGVQGAFTLSNYAWAPYSAGPDGTVIPLPRGFKGVIVGEADQSSVTGDPNAGFRLLRPIPPGGKQFHGGFSMPIHDGRIEWAMDLPFGAYDSSFKVLKTPDMRMVAPLRVETSNAPGFGAVYSIDPIRILPQQSMVLTLSGMPQAPAWRLWVPRILGLVVIAMILAGVGFALLRRPTTTPEQESQGSARAARRELLLAELVELERDNHAKGRLDDKAKRRRETLITELEALWGD